MERDTYTTTTGARDDKNVFAFKISELKPSTEVTLRACVRSDAGTDSNGEIQ